MRYLPLTRALVLCGLLLASAVASALTVELKDSEKADAKSLGEVTLYNQSHALVIGNDDYANGWPRLSNAVRDAREVAGALEGQGFTVDLQLNLTAQQLQAALKNFFIVKGAQPDARLLLWYAGHGHTIDGEGFLVATDTPLQDDPNFKLNAVHMREFGGWVRLAESKHVLAVFDSCFSGTIFSAQRSRPPAAITHATTYPVRQFITSGDADQLVLDNGTFRELFVRSINGEDRADVNQDGYLTASELGLFLSDKITNLTQAHQTPRYGKLRDKDYDRGDFVVSVLKEQKALVDSVSKLQSIEAENLFWESVKQIDTPAAYQAYIDHFPTGRFVPMAKMHRSHAASPQSSRAENSRPSAQMTEAPQSSRSQPVREPEPTGAKSMTELIAEAKARRAQRQREKADALRVQSSLQAAQIEQQLLDKKQCRLDCEDRYYGGMKGNAREQAEYRCGYAYDYQACMKKETGRWRAGEVKQCKKKC